MPPVGPRLRRGERTTAADCVVCGRTTVRHSIYCPRCRWLVFWHGSGHPAYQRAFREAWDPELDGFVCRYTGVRLDDEMGGPWSLNFDHQIPGDRREFVVTACRGDGAPWAGRAPPAAAGLLLEHPQSFQDQLPVLEPPLEGLALLEGLGEEHGRGRAWGGWATVVGKGVSGWRPRFAKGGWVRGAPDLFALSRDAMVDPVEKGKLVEMVVGEHLARLVGDLKPGDFITHHESLLHWRKKGSEREVDFVIDAGNGRRPVEVKYQGSISGRDVAGLRAFQGGVVVSKDTLETRNGHAIVPAELFLALF